MIKKRTLILFGAGLAAVSLIGGTFAAWAVTDNANPFGITIVPGDVATDQNDLVTLSYGENTTYSNISDLAKNTHRLGATVELVADTSNGHTYTGKFHIEFRDTTVRVDPEQKKMTDYLTVDVFNDQVAFSNGELSADAYATATNQYLHPNLLGTLDKNSENLQKDIEIEVTDNVATRVQVCVSLGNVDASTLEVIKHDTVSLYMDWEPVLGVGDVETSLIYLKTASDKKAYVYAWNENGANAEYPGIRMKEEYDGYYSYGISSEYSNLLFVVFNSDDSQYFKSADLERNNDKNCYDQTAQSPAWVVDPQLNTELTSLTKDFYLVGSFAASNWCRKAGFGLTQTGDPNIYEITGIQLNAGDEIKIQSRNGAHFFSCDTAGNNFTLENGAGSNMVVSETDTYTIQLYVEHNEHNHVVLVGANDQ